MMKKKIAAMIVAAAFGAVSLAGCGGSAEPARTASTEAAGAVETEEQKASGTEAAEGAELNIMLPSPVQSLDPQQATDGYSNEIIGDLMDGLTQLDAAGRTIPGIAESWDVSEDGLTYTFHLREAKWSNGDPVTAADFVYSWQRAVDPVVASEYSYMISDIAQVKNAAEIIAGKKDKSELGMKAIDDRTLEIQLNVPVSYFTSLLMITTYYPVNQKFCEACGDTFGTSPETVLSNGAFMLEQYEPAANAFHLVKNPNYWNADNVKLAGLNYQVIQDSQQALMSYQAGDLDYTLLSGDQVDQVRDDPEFLTMGAGFLWYVTPNLAGVPELANRNIRYALTHAIDRDSITVDVLKDGSVPTYTAVPLEFATGPDGSDFSGDQSIFSDVCASDKEKAAAFWSEGLSELGISELTLEMVVDADDAPQKVAQVLKEQWETTLPGLTVNLKIEPKKQRLQDLQEGNYQLGLTRWGPDYADPMTYLGMWITGNNNNYGGWSNEEYDSIIEECTTGALCTDLEGRWLRLYDAERLVMEDAVIFPIYTQCNAMMIKSNVTGIEFHSFGINPVYKNVVKTN